jgi:hypothetical protein
MEAQKIASKDNTEFYGSDNLSWTSTHTLPYKRVGFLGQPTPVSPSKEPSPHRSRSPIDRPRQHH